jgi:hypothetical protein
MKKFKFLFIGLMSVSTFYAQDLSDAIRYSQSEIQGTARFRALSGAFGALGGDMSAVNINPAGSAVFAQSHASFTVSNLGTKNETGYFNGLTNTSESNFDFNQGGASFVFANSNPDSQWKKFTIGVAYDKMNSYDDNWNADGINTNDEFFVDENGNFASPANSIAGYFLLYSENVRLGDISLLGGESITDAYSDIGNVFGFTHQQAFLGYQSFILEPDVDDDNNTSYRANLNAGNFDHNYSYASTGLNGKVAFNMATQYGDNLYLGLNLNSHFINYDRSTSLIENDLNNSAISYVEFDNTLSTRGSGFSFQLGGILKLSNEFRVGLAYDSPTWFTISEETTQSLFTDGSFGPKNVRPQIINIYPDYKLQTPAKITGSLAYVFGTQGLLSFDYSVKDYSATKFKPAGDFTGLNADVANLLTSAATYRIGGEYKIEKFSLRGGYRFEESPYANGFTVGDLTGYSLGVGYNFGNTKLDVTYDAFERTSETPLFNVGLTDAAVINNTNSNITLSLSFNI